MKYLMLSPSSLVYCLIVVLVAASTSTLVVLGTSIAAQRTKGRFFKEAHVRLVRLGEVFLVLVYNVVK